MGSKRLSTVRRSSCKVVVKDNLAQVLCPFCLPPHPISLAGPAACGTTVKVVAHQILYSAVPCSLCGESSGTLVRIADQYVHVKGCTPGRRLYTSPPKASKLASLAWRLPAAYHKWLRRRGKVVVELRKGAQVAGYAFDKAVPND